MTYDFLIIGAGIAGVSLAYELAPHARVCVLEAEERPGTQATARSAALFAPSYGGPEFRALTRASRAFFLSPPSGFSESKLLTPRGCMYIARHDQTARLESMVAGIRRSGGTMATIAAEDSHVRVPLLRQSYVAAAAYDSDAMDIDVDALLQGFLRAARAAGALILTGRKPLHFQRQSGIWRASIEGAELSAAILINAAGAWADQVGVACGARPLGFLPLRRTALLVDPPAGVNVAHWPAVIDVDEEFYFKPDAGRLLLSPADETPDVPRDAYPEDLDVAIAVDRVQAALDFDVQRVSHSWAGLRTFSKDRAPVIGFDTEVPGLFWCAGQGGYGIQTAPALARFAAALARGEAVPSDIHAEDLSAARLAPQRFDDAPT
jgi:D-arginine dehydrogenase